MISENNPYNFNATANRNRIMEIDEQPSRLDLDNTGHVIMSRDNTVLHS